MISFNGRIWLYLKSISIWAIERQGDAIIMRPVNAKKISKVEEGPKILNYSGPTVSLDEMDQAIVKGAVQSL